jgi:hypothetical protein
LSVVVHRRVDTRNGKSFVCSFAVQRARHDLGHGLLDLLGGLELFHGRPVQHAYDSIDWRQQTPPHRLFFLVEIVWVLTRDPIPEKATVEKALNVLERNGFGKRSFLITDQKNCNGVKRKY